MSEHYNKTYPISWEQLHRDAKALAWRLVDIEEWKGIVAITRGGLVPAAIISRELDIHLVDTICISSYEWKDQGGINILKKVQGDGSGWLLIDDLVDTGKTLELVRRLCLKDIVTLLMHPIVVVSVSTVIDVVISKLIDGQKNEKSIPYQ